MYTKPQILVDGVYRFCQKFSLILGTYVQGDFERKDEHLQKTPENKISSLTKQYLQCLSVISQNENIRELVRVEVPKRRHDPVVDVGKHLFRDVRGAHRREPLGRDDKQWEKQQTVNHRLCDTTQPRHSARWPIQVSSTDRRQLFNQFSKLFACFVLRCHRCRQLKGLEAAICRAEVRVFVAVSK